MSNSKSTVQHSIAADWTTMHRQSSTVDGKLAALILRPSTKATYLGEQGKERVWAVTIEVQPEDQFTIIDHDPATGEETRYTPCPGELCDVQAFHATSDAMAYSIIGTLLICGVELRADSTDLAQELASLLRDAAAETSWTMPTSTGEQIRLTKMGQAILRTAAEAIEYDGHATISLTDIQPMQPTVPEIFQAGVTRLPSQFPLPALLQAIHSGASGKGWEDCNGERVPTHTTQPKKGGAVYVSVRPTDGSLAPAMDVLPNLWEQVRRLDDLTSDALLLCLAHWATRSNGPGQPVWITADAILDARGIKRIHKPGEPGNWQHGHRTEDRMAAGRALAQLDALWLEIVDLEVIPGGKRRKPQRITVESRALAMLDKMTQHDLDGESVFLAARVMPGEWAAKYWELGLRQTGLLAQAVLGYDPYRQIPEKRLGKYLAFQFRWNARNARITRHVATLMENAGLEPDRRNPQRTRDRLERALSRLKEDKIISDWGYVAEAAPAPARGWLPHWLELSVWITPPTAIKDHYAQLYS